MKRIVLTLAALTFSVTGFASDNLDGYADVLQDQVSSSSSYSAPETSIENHGSVLLDQVADNRGIDSEIEVGDSNSSLFDTDAESAF